LEAGYPHADWRAAVGAFLDEGHVLLAAHYRELLRAPVEVALDEVLAYRRDDPLLGLGLRPIEIPCDLGQ
jgi:hypothetical protein